MSRQVCRPLRLHVSIRRCFRAAARLQEYEAPLDDGHQRLVAPRVPVELVRRKLRVRLHIDQLRAQADRVLALKILKIQ